MSFSSSCSTSGTGSPSLASRRQRVAWSKNVRTRRQTPAAISLSSSPDSAAASPQVSPLDVASAIRRVTVVSPIWRLGTLMMRCSEISSAGLAMNFR